MQILSACLCLSKTQVTGLALKSHHDGHFDQEVHLIILTCALRHTGVRKQPSVSPKAQTGIIKFSHICINTNECVADHKRTGRDPSCVMQQLHVTSADMCLVL